MRLIEHFSVYLDLPIKIDDIASFLIEEYGCVSNIQFHPTDEDGEALAGMLVLRRYKPPYVSGDELTVAHVSYNTKRAEAEQRLVCAKELIHILDPEISAAKTEDEVNRLVREIVTPIQALKEIESLGIETVTDHTGYLKATALLFPIEAREELKPLYDKDILSPEEIESIVEIPSSWVRVVMTDEWPKIYESMMKRDE